MPDLAKVHLKVSVADAQDANKPVKGAVFSITGATLTTPGTITTGDDGTAVFEVSASATYQVQQTSAPDEYDLAFPPLQTVTVGTADPTPVTFAGAPRGHLVVKAVSSADATVMVAGASFLVSSDTLPAPRSLTTADNGAVGTYLSKGDYVVTQTATPSGYGLPLAPAQSANVVAGTDVALTFADPPTRQLTIHAIDTANRTISGAAFVVMQGTTRVADGTTSEDGSAKITLPAGEYMVVQTAAAPHHSLPTQPKVAVTVRPGSDESVTLAPNAPCGKLTIKAQDAKDAKKTLAGATFDVVNGNVSKQTVTTDTEGIVVEVDAATYTVTETKSPAGYGIAEAAQTIVVASGDEKTLTFTNTAVVPQTTGFGIGFWFSILVVVLFAVWALIAAFILKHRLLDQVFAATVLSVGLFLLTVIGGRRYGFLAPLIGEDHRASTSKTQIGIWTVVLGWTLAYFAGRAIFGDGKSPFDQSFTDQWDSYLILLGGPFAAGVLAKAATTWKVQNGTLQKTTNDDAVKVTQLAQNDAGQADLVDSQYLLFNFVALGYFIAMMFQAAKLPELPSTILGMTSGSAALYSANKAVAANKPIITSIVPATASPGTTITVNGQNFRPGDDDPGHHVALQLEGFGPLAVSAETNSSIQAAIPPGAPTGQKNVTVTTTAGVTTDPWPVLLQADQAQILGIREATAFPGLPIHIFGRRFRSPLEPDATRATILFDGKTAAPGILSGVTSADGFDEIGTNVPTGLTGTQVTVQVQSIVGTASTGMVLPLASAPEITETKAVRTADGSVQVRIVMRGFLNPSGLRTNQTVCVNGTAPGAFTATRIDGLDTVTFTIPDPAGNALALTFSDELGRATPAVTVPISVS